MFSWNEIQTALKLCVFWTFLRLFYCSLTLDGRVESLVLTSNINFKNSEIPVEQSLNTTPIYLNNHSKTPMKLLYARWIHVEKELIREPKLLFPLRHKVKPRSADHLHNKTQTSEPDSSPETNQERSARPHTTPARATSAVAKYKDATTKPTDILLSFATKSSATGGELTVLNAAAMTPLKTTPESSITTLPLYPNTPSRTPLFTFASAPTSQLPIVKRTEEHAFHSPDVTTENNTIADGVMCTIADVNTGMSSKNDFCRCFLKAF